MLQDPTEQNNTEDGRDASESESEFLGSETYMQWLIMVHVEGYLSVPQGPIVYGSTHNHETFIPSFLAQVAR